MRDRIYLFFIATYLAEGLIGIAYEPISYLLKDGLHLTAAQSATFVCWMTLPFLLKPLLGLLTDALPIMGRRRLPYLLIFSAATSAGWVALAAMRAYSYLPTLLLLTMVNVGIAFADVLCDAVMVERGNRLDKTGPYQAAQIGALYAAMLATGLGGGWLAQNASYKLIFSLTAAPPLLVFVTAFLVEEKPRPLGLGTAREALRGMGLLLRRGSFWAACLMIFLYNFNPFQGTAFFYFQNDVLKFSKTFIGALDSVSGLAGVAGAAAFGRLYGRSLGSERMDTGRFVRWSVLAGAPLTLLYLAYRGAASALILTALFGAAGVIMRLSLMDLAARSCPEHGEATAFALFMAVFNLAAWGSNAVGGKFYSDLSAGHAGPTGAIAALIVLSALCTAACWPLLYLVPPITHFTLFSPVEGVKCVMGGTERER